MASYPTHIKRCQHIKINGIQCGSPALTESIFCYFHIRHHWPELEAIPNHCEWQRTTPTLEDANSIQVTLGQIMFRLMTEDIDHKAAALLLYALQIASINLKRVSLEPSEPTQVVIDRTSVAHRPIGASAWSRIEDHEYDDLAASSGVDSQLPPEKRPPQPAAFLPGASEPSRSANS